MNIFHELAEKAFEGEFQLITRHSAKSTVFSHLPALSDISALWNSFGFGETLFFYDNMQPDEQSLALLFIGEMYESQN